MIGEMKYWWRGGSKGIFGNYKWIFARLWI